jgi:hypothetical protein
MDSFLTLNMKTRLNGSFFTGIIDTVSLFDSLYKRSCTYAAYRAPKLHLILFPNNEYIVCTTLAFVLLILVDPKDKGHMVTGTQYRQGD